MTAPRTLLALAAAFLPLLPAAPARAGDHEDYADHDFGLRLPAALSRFTRFPDVAGTAGASAGAVWGSASNPAGAAWLSQEGLSPQFARVVFEEGTRIDVASASWSADLGEWGTLQPSLARARSNRATMRDGTEFEYGTLVEEMQWAIRPREDTAWGLNLFASQSEAEFGRGGLTLTRSRSSGGGLRAGVLRQFSEPLRAGASLEYSFSVDRSRLSIPGLPVVRDGGHSRQVLFQPGVAWEYGKARRVYLDYEFGWFGDGKGALRAHRFLAGVDHEIVGPLNVRAGTVVDTRGNAALALGVGIFPSDHVFIDIAWQRDMFPEVRREFGRSQAFSLSVSVLF